VGLELLHLIGPLGVVATENLAPRADKEQLGRVLDVGHFAGGHGDPRLFVVEKTGRIQVIADGVVQPKPFLSLYVSSMVANRWGCRI
jgi:hypothetical protein